MSFKNPLNLGMNNNPNNQHSPNFNPNSKEFVPFIGSSTPQNSLNPEERRLRKLAKQLNSLGVLDDDSPSDEDTTNNPAPQTPNKNEDSSVFQQQPNASKSPVKSHNSSASSGIGGSLVSSLRLMAEQSTSSGFDDQKTTSKTITVPSSEHVAEIVGKQGCKIKALRSKTNTYIKTPVRGEEPNFVITGHRVDVESAVREIQEAADHFTMIRQQRSRQHFDFVQKSGNNSGDRMNHPSSMDSRERIADRMSGEIRMRMSEDGGKSHPLSKSGNLPFMQDRHNSGIERDFMSNRSSSPKQQEFSLFADKSENLEDRFSGDFGKPSEFGRDPWKSGDFGKSGELGKPDFGKPDFGTSLGSFEKPSFEKPRFGSRPQKDEFSGVSMWGQSERSNTPTDDFNKPRQIPPHLQSQKYPVKNPEDISFGGYTLDSFDPDLLAKQITLKVRVPYNVVGLVVGPKGSTIKRIQTTTQTYIVTPSKDKEPVFEVTGLPENAERAREEIQSHIATRTGADQLDPDEEFKLNGNETVLPDLDLSDNTTETRNQNLIDPFNSNPMRPVKSVTPPGFNEPAFGTISGHISGHKTPDSVKLDIFGAVQERKSFEQKSPQQKSPGLFSNPLREAFESPIGADVIQKLVGIDDDDEEISEFEKDNALEALQKLTPEEKIKLSEVIEKMKREKAAQKKIEDENKMNSIFEPDSLAKQKPAPSIDNVLIGKATPGPANPNPQTHRRAHIDHPSQYSHHPGVTDNRSVHYREHSPQFGGSGYGQGYPRHPEQFYGGGYPGHHHPGHHHGYHQGPPHGYHGHHQGHPGHHGPPRGYYDDMPQGNYANRGYPGSRADNSRMMMGYQQKEPSVAGVPPTVPGVNRAGKCLVCREKQITMALVPCGHNLFCEECAMRITHGNKNLHANPVCPECFEPVNMAIKIKM
jgi:hypothetical protein